MRQSFIITVVFISGNLFAAGNFEKSARTTTAHPGGHEAERGNGLCFTKNNGQIIDMGGNLCPEVLYKGNAGEAQIYLRKTGLSYVLGDLGEIMHEADEREEEIERNNRNDEQNNQAAVRNVKQERIANQKLNFHRVDVDFINCNRDPEIYERDQLEGYSNYYYPHCPQGILKVNSYNEVIIKNIYNNIDLKYYGAKGQACQPEGTPARRQGLKYDIIVKPGGNPDQIKLKYSGADEVEIKDGELRIKNSIAEMTEVLPKVYQNINGKIIDVKTEYRLEYLSNNEVIVHFLFSIFNSSFPLVVDPWITYYGGSDVEQGQGIDTDNNGNIVITGATSSFDFPVTAGAFQVVQKSFSNAFVVKFNNAGNRLWATYYGGTFGEEGRGICVDKSGSNEISITGITYSTDFPVTAGAFQGVSGGGTSDAFVVKFNPAGARLWATFYGGSSGDYGVGVVADIGGNIAITGCTESTNFPVTGGAFQLTKAGLWDAFVVKFNSAGNRLWATYYGGTADEYMYNAISTDSSGNFIITGQTKSANFPVSAGAFQLALNGIKEDAYIVKFNPAGGRLWATYYGGSDFDFGQSVTTDNIGNVIVSGLTYSPDLPVTAGAFQIIRKGASDAFIIKFDPAGNRLWSTYYGGTAGREEGNGVITDGNNDIYLGGDTYSSDMPIGTCAFQSVFGGKEDLFFAHFDPNGQFICSTYVGGNSVQDDETLPGNCIAIYKNTVFLLGYAFPVFPVTPGAFQTTNAGSYDLVIASLCASMCGSPTVGTIAFTNNNGFCPNSAQNFNGSYTTSCSGAVPVYSWTFAGGTPNFSAQQNPSGIIYAVAGTYAVKLVVDDGCNKDSLTENIVVNSCACSLSAQSTVLSNPACSVGTGSVSVTISNGSGPYTYSWSTGVSAISTFATYQFNGITAGSYTITVTDAGSCISTVTAVIISPSALAGQFVKGTANCAGCGCKEWIMTTATGGTTPYTYTWSDGYINRYKNQLCPGNYTINIKDKNGCGINVNLTVP
ncbi:MAG: hypothetical protein HYU69_00530 [Bacteroidetes bacterium]|nr:hypothetical protein [Bacteroidota bacterium]